MPDELTLDVIAVGAHPDDVEIGCGGTLASLVAQGFSVGIVDLTDGEPTPGSSGPEMRLAEAKEAAAALGVAHRYTLDFTNRRLFDSFEARVALAKLLRRHRPQVVIGLGEKTPLASPDHWQAMQIVDAAVFYSRLSKWDDHFEGLAVHSVPMQLYYTLSFGIPELTSLPGQIVVDISDSLAAKLAAVRCYASQFPPTKQYVLERVEAIARYHGMSAGYAAGELLASPRRIGTRDLLGTLFGRDKG